MRTDPLDHLARHVRAVIADGATQRGGIGVNAPVPPLSSAMAFERRAARVVRSRFSQAKAKAEAQTRADATSARR